MLTSVVKIGQNPANVPYKSTTKVILEYSCIVIKKNTASQDIYLMFLKKGSHLTFAICKQIYGRNMKIWQHMTK